MRKLTIAFSVLLTLLAFARAATAQDIILTGVIDGPLTGGVPKAVELFVLDQIDDLSVCGVGSANNGGGTDGEEFTFPAISVPGGSFLYVTSQAEGFLSFFGFDADFTSGAVNINGDDAIELFCNGLVVDIFGDIDVDASGTAWDHVDGWTYRNDNTGPDGNTFILANWSFSGINALDGETTNATAATPFPIGTFATLGGDAAPRVISTAPADGDSGVAPNTDIQVTFNEQVNVNAGTWFGIDCSVSGGVAATDSSADNTSFTLVPNADLAAGEICTVTIIADQVTDVDNEDPPDNMLADFVFDFSTALPIDIVINEISADPDAVLGDANGDGTVNTSEDEFIEIYNNTGGPLDLTGWTLSDAVGIRHEFSPGTMIDQDCAILVFGGGTPTGEFGFAAVQTASAGFLGFNNGGDTLTLNDGTVDVAQQIYGSEGGGNQSLTRDPDVTGAFVLHSTATGAGGALSSPGTNVDGSMFSGCSEPVIVPIHDIQGAGNVSPFNGAAVLLEGIVTGDFQDGDADNLSNLRGFYVQEELPDADLQTSEGVFVFDGATPTVEVVVGDRVRVRGTVAEFFGDTQISSSSVEIVGTGSIAPTVISFPVASTIVNANGLFIADLEAYEGMLVSIPQVMTVNGLNNLDRFGEALLSSGDRLFQFTNDNAPDPVGLVAHQQAAALRSVMLDDGLSIQNPDPIRFPAPGLPNNSGVTLRSGDTVSGLVGNIRFSRSSGGSGKETFRLMPTQEPAFSPDNQRNATPPDVGGKLRVSSLNVLNFFTTLDGNGQICGPNVNLGCRGADSVIEFDRQREKAVTALSALDADVVGLVEIENNNAEALQSLVDGLNALGGDTYSFIDTGAIGTDAIRVGLLYRTAIVTPLGDFAILDSTVDPRFIDFRNRPVLAQSFTDNAGGGVFTVAVTHLKSKGAACDDLGDPDLNDGQGNCNITRTQAAAAMADWLAADPTASNDDDYLIVGDLNANLAEDPVTTLEAAGFDNLLSQFIGAQAYSFVFNDEASALDHALSTPSLTDQITGVTEWHINADEPDAFDYNLEFGRNPALFDGAIPFRVADHDPLIVGLDLVSDIRGDLDKDGDIDVQDLRVFFRAFLSRIGQRRYNADADFDGNGFVGFKDFRTMLRLFFEANRKH